MAKPESLYYDPVKLLQSTTASPTNRWQHPLQQLRRQSTRLPILINLDERRRDQSNYEPARLLECCNLAEQDTDRRYSAEHAAYAQDRWPDDAKPGSQLVK